MKNVIKENKCDGIVRYFINPTNEEIEKGYKYIDFEIIDITKNDEEFINKLAIIRGDIYQACKGIVDKCIVVFDWDTDDISGSIKSIEDFVNDENMEDIPIFFIFDRCVEKSFLWTIVLSVNGYMPANHLVDFENNDILVKTKRETYNSMIKKRYEEYKNFHHLN